MQILNRFSFWLLNILFWTALSFILYLILHPLSPQSGYAVTRTLLFTAIGFLFTCLFHFLYHEIFQTKSIAIVGAATLIFCIVFGTAWIYLLECLTWYVYPEAAEMELLRKFAAKASLNNAFILLAWCVSYIGASQWRKMKEQQQQASQATALAREAQLQLLRYQLNPHFLFNALNSVRRLVEENPVAARHMITQLSEFLRYSLQEVHTNHTTLSRELECVRNYLALEKIRFEDQLVIDYSVEKSAEHITVPAFLLMPLVENAVKHGTQTSPEPLQICIGARVHDGHLEVSVRNKGSWVEPSQNNGSSTGLTNLKQRLEQLLPGRHRLEIGEKKGMVEAVLQIQLNRESGE